MPTGEHFAVGRAILADPRETLGIELAQVLPLEVTGLWGFLFRSSVTFGEMLRCAERYMRIASHARSLCWRSAVSGSPWFVPVPFRRRTAVANR